MKILIIGGSGVIGSKLLGYLKSSFNVEFTYFSHKVPFKKGKILDIIDHNATVNFIEKINPDIVIHTTALTNVDLCETNRGLADSINVKGTQNIVEGCKRTKSKIIFISTSAIFDGTKDKYYEDDLPNPINYYGLTKLKSEELVKQADLPYLILRTDQPYCWIEKWQHTNSVLRVIQTLKSGQIHKEIVDWYNTPTYVPDLVLAIKELIDKDATGIFHIVGSDYVNRYDLALLTADIFGLDKNMILPIKSDTLDLPAKRANVYLDNQKIFLNTGVHVGRIKDGLMQMLNG